MDLPLYPGGAKVAGTALLGREGGSEEAPRLTERRAVLAFLPTPAIEQLRNGAWYGMEEK